jgi:hypothetical protein
VRCGAKAQQNNEEKPYTVPAPLGDQFATSEKHKAGAQTFQPERRQVRV